MSCWLVPRVAGHAGVVLGGKRRLALRKGLARRAAGLRPHRDVRLPGWNGAEAELPRFAQSSNLVSGHRPPEPLQLRLANRSGVNGVLNRCVYAWSEEDLRSPGSGAEPRVQVGYGSESTVVVATLEADPTERRVPRLDADAKGELAATLSPQLP